MNHLESNIKIYFTRDYSIFKNIAGNRLLNENKINKIIYEIKNGLDVLSYCPIIVDEDMRVIDGQHRLYIARKLQSNIWYVISKKKLSILDIAKVNTNTERWKLKDFIQCYSSQKNENYIYLQEFMDKYSFKSSVSLNLLYYGSKPIDSGFKKQLLEEGKFEVKHKDFAIQIGELSKRFIPFKEHNSRQFILALIKIIAFNKCDIELLFKKINERPDLLIKCDTMKDYCILLEDIYNYRSKSRAMIYGK